MHAPQAEHFAGGDQRQAGDARTARAECGWRGRDENQGGGERQRQPGSLPEEPSAKAYETGAGVTSSQIV